MGLEMFIEKFKSQLEDVDTMVLAETDYVNSDFWDSLTAMVIKVMIEDEYGVDVPLEVLNECNSVESLFKYIQSTKNG